MGRCSEGQGPGSGSVLERPCPRGLLWSEVTEKPAGIQGTSSLSADISRERRAAIRGTSSLTVELSVGTELWSMWGQIALAQAWLAAEGRAEIVARSAAREEFDLNVELVPSMLAITAAVTSLDGFAAVVKAAGLQVTEDQYSTRASWVWALLREGFDVASKTNDWPRALKDLYILRSDQAAGGLLHPKTLFGRAVDHPVVPGVAPVRALYTVERVDAAIGLMRDIYGTCRGRVREEHAELASRISGVEGLLQILSD